VDREVFLNLLSHLNPRLPLKGYEYIGFGGPFLEDFRLVHNRIGMSKLTCVEQEEDVHSRQAFNRLSYVTLVHNDMKSYLDSRDLSAQPSIVWLDFNSKASAEEILLATRFARNCKCPSLIKLTLCSSPPSRPKKEKEESSSKYWARYLNLVKEQLGAFSPATFAQDDATAKGYARVVHDSFRRALDAELSNTGVSYKGINSFHYADGSSMISSTILTMEKGSEESTLSEAMLDEWDFFQPDWPSARLIDMPILSAHERRSIESQLEDPAARAGTNGDPKTFVPDGRLGSKSEVLESFRCFYRLYPQFARVEL
jgi:hypothetical protein